MAQGKRIRNMRKILVLVAVVIVASVLYKNSQNKNNPNQLTPSQISPIQSKNSATEIPKTTVIAQNLDTPWAIAFIDENNMLITQRNGTVLLNSLPITKIDKVREIGEGGLLGVDLHPDFSVNHFVYFYYTYSGSGNDTLNRVVRMTYQNNSLTEETIIVDAIPGAANHNGGRIKFGPDGFLYIGTGDAQEPSRAQNIQSLAGKILRVTDDGKPASNPFNNAVFSFGHRNVQGLAWDDKGNLWATEHGRSGVLSGLDELNLIESGKNYGWPDIQGNETRSGMVTPKRNSGNDTWAPSGTAIIGNSLFFSGLRGQALYEAIIQNDNITDLKEHFKGEFGRIREVIVGPDKMLYITTSNLDGRGNPKTGDDKIIRVNPVML